MAIYFIAFIKVTWQVKGMQTVWNLCANHAIVYTDTSQQSLSLSSFVHVFLVTNAIMAGQYLSRKVMSKPEAQQG